MIITFVIQLVWIRSVNITISTNDNAGEIKKKGNNDENKLHNGEIISLAIISKVWAVIMNATAKEMKTRGNRNLWKINKF